MKHDGNCIWWYQHSWYDCRFINTYKFWSQEILHTKVHKFVTTTNKQNCKITHVLCQVGLICFGLRGSKFRAVSQSVSESVSEWPKWVKRAAGAAKNYIYAVSGVSDLYQLPMHKMQDSRWGIKSKNCKIAQRMDTIGLPTGFFWV